MLPGNGNKFPASRPTHYPAERVVQRRHDVDGAYPSLCAQSRQSVQIGATTSGWNRREFQPIRLGRQLESRVSQRVYRYHVAGLE